MIIDSTDDNEDLEKFIEGETGVRSVGAYWLNQGSYYLLLIIQFFVWDKSKSYIFS